jgi:hypothetical protein
MPAFVSVLQNYVSIFNYADLAAPNLVVRCESWSGYEYSVSGSCAGQVSLFAWPAPLVSSP